MTKKTKYKWTENQLRKQKEFGRIGGIIGSENRRKKTQLEQITKAVEKKLQKIDQEIRNNPEQALRALGVPKAQIPQAIQQVREEEEKIKMEKLQEMAFLKYPELSVIAQFMQNQDKQTKGQPKGDF